MVAHDPHPRPLRLQRARPAVPDRGGVFTFFLVIDRLYQLTDLVITKSVPFVLVLPLLIYVARLREGGHRVTRYVVQLYSKLSFPLVHVIMAVFAGIGTALFLSART